MPENLREFVKQTVCSAGDAVIFTEATMHSTLPWTADYQRRSVLFRYSPANSAFGGGRHAFDSEFRVGDAWPAEWYAGLSDAQRQANALGHGVSRKVGVAPNWGWRAKLGVVWI